MGYFSQKVENIGGLFMQEVVQTELYPACLRRMERYAWVLGEGTPEHKAEVVVDCSVSYITEAKKVTPFMLHSALNTWAYQIFTRYQWDRYNYFPILID